MFAIGTLRVFLATTPPPPPPLLLLFITHNMHNKQTNLMSKVHAVKTQKKKDCHLVQTIFDRKVKVDVNNVMI